MEKPVHTLAQSETTPMKKPLKLLKGNGSEISDRRVLMGRAKRKQISTAIVLEMINIAQLKEDKHMEKSLWNTYHCQRKITLHNNRTYGNYCKNRFCSICMSNRKADLINKYKPEISTWEDPQFLTLTRKSIAAKSLNEHMMAMHTAFKKIHTKLKTQHARGLGPKVMGIRTLECNFNPIAKTYNPHFHIIVPSKEVAELLMKEWILRWTPKYAKKYCQNIRPIRNMDKGLIETIKYGTKVFNEPKDTYGKKKRGETKIYIQAQYNIIKALQGLRIFERFGFNTQHSKNTSGSFKTIDKYDELTYDNGATDWVNELTGSLLTHYTPSFELEDILAHKIDTELQ